MFQTVCIKEKEQRNFYVDKLKKNTYVGGVLI